MCTNVLTQKGSHSCSIPCTAKSSGTLCPYFVHICASFGCTHVFSPPCTHAIGDTHVCTECHMCKPRALHAPRSTGSPVYFYVSNHCTEAQTFLPTPLPDRLLLRCLRTSHVRLSAMARLLLAVRPPHAGAIPATAPEGPATLANLVRTLIKHQNV